MHMPPHDDFSLEEYLYVRVVKARDLDVTDRSCDPHVEIRLGKYKETTRDYTTNRNNEWNQVFAFVMAKVEATMLEVTLKDAYDFMGWVLYNLCDIPKRVQPESPLAPQWYRLTDRKGNKLKGELMLVVWWGTQADEAFRSANYGGVVGGFASIRSMVYLLPRLWYVRVNVIEGHDMIPSDTTRTPKSFVKIILGYQSMETRISMTKSKNPFWNEELMFVALEPFEGVMIVSVEDRVEPNKDEVLGRCIIPLTYVERRSDHKNIRSRWFNLENYVMIEGQLTKQAKFVSRIHMRICLEGGYHVLDESTNYISDFRPVSKKLWKESIGILELRIVSAHGLPPMKTKDGRTATDAYCVAKYGPKWVRTRTILDSFTPKWNEQYTWQVYDPCTILTIGVFDNFCLKGEDTRIGKVRIRISTLETGRVYIHSYPLLVLHPYGVKKMGEINLAVRFTCPSLLNLMHMYSQPLLPKMHYTYPLTLTQIDSLRHHATKIISMRLSRHEPPLRKEVVEYMLDVGCERRIKVNFLRMNKVFGGLIAAGNWFGEMYNWKNHINIVVIHIIIFTLAMYPQLILSSIFSFLFQVGVRNYKRRPRHPPHMDAGLWCADRAELDEELDTFQRMIGDIATQWERLESLLSWRDPIATTMFVIFCLIAALVLYVTPFYVVVIQTVISVLTHLSFQSKLPSAPINFFARLPVRTDTML